uniref:Apoptosis antagonizing transcription factor n=1 Tax=Eptatretus burgeri TaxID=7764 RepID=A0A8C4WXT9_EPTBU
MAETVSNRISRLLATRPLLDPEDDGWDEASAAKVVSRLEEEAYVEDRNPPRDGSRLRKVVGNMGVLDPCYRAKATSRRLLEEEESSSKEKCFSEDHEKLFMAAEDPLNDGRGNEDWYEFSSEKEKVFVDESAPEIEPTFAPGAKEMVTLKMKQGDEERGQAVKDQLAMWDYLLEARIALQRVLSPANQLPHPVISTHPLFIGTADIQTAVNQGHQTLIQLSESLLELQKALMLHFPGTKALEENDEEMDLMGCTDGESNKRRKIEDMDVKCTQDACGGSKILSKRFMEFQEFRDKALTEWDDRTRLTSLESRPILSRVHLALCDMRRLITRTQVGRLCDETGNCEKKFDEEKYNDDDFYHQLLRELIERKTLLTDPNGQVSWGRQWLDLQKLRNRVKRHVDRRASKGRKLRYDIHPKLVSLMAPHDTTSMDDTARSDLFRSLFGEKEPGF